MSYTKVTLIWFPTLISLRVWTKTKIFKTSVEGNVKTNVVWAFPHLIQWNILELPVAPDV